MAWMSNLLLLRWHVLWDNVSSVKTTDKRNVTNVRIVRITLCWLSAIVLCVAIVSLLNLNLLVFSSLYLGFNLSKMSKYLHLQEMLLNLWFCTPNILKWPVDCVYRLIPQWFVVFYWNFDKSYPTVADCTYMSINLMGNLAKFCQMTWKMQWTAYIPCM